MPFGMVGRTYERPGFDVVKTEFPFTAFFQFLKCVRMHKTFDGQVSSGRLQVLSQRDDIDAGLFQVGHRLEHFFVGFTETEHQARFNTHRQAALLTRPGRAA